MTLSASNRFSFDFYQFRGRGNKPSLAPTADQANFMSSRISIEESMSDTTVKRMRSETLLGRNSHRGS